MSNLINLYLASDHAGFEVKEKLLSELFSDYPSIGMAKNSLIILHQKGDQAVLLHDLGPFSSDSIDYPIYAQKVTQSLMEDPNSLGVLICGTGQGMAMTANKETHIRCALCRDSEDAQMAVEHNHANMIAVGARKSSYQTILDILVTFLNSQPSLEKRHQRRVEMFSFMK